MNSLSEPRGAASVTAIITAMTDPEREFLGRTLGGVLCQDGVREVLIAIADTNTWITAVLHSIPEMYQRMPVRLLRMPLQPLMHARNRCVEASETEWIGFCDGDDVWLAGKLRQQLLLANRTGADLVGCDHVLVDEVDRRMFFPRCRSNPLPSSWLIKRSLIAQFPFDETLPRSARFGWAEDILWLKSHASRCVVRRLPAVRLAYRVRSSSITSAPSANSGGLPGKRFLAVSRRNEICRLGILGSSYCLRLLFLKSTYATVRKWPV